MNTQQVACFLEVAQCGNFTRAAERLHITQPTLSRNISQLEDELSLTLLVRKRHQRTQLTAAGLALQEGLLAAKASVLQAISKAKSASIPLRLGMLEGQMVDDQLRAILCEFLSVNQNVRLEVVQKTYQELVAELHSGQLDIAATIHWDLCDDPGLDVVPTYKLPTQLILPARYAPKDLDREHSLSEFQHIPFICAEESGSQTNFKLIHDAAGQAGFTPTIQIVDSLSTQTLYIELGYGMCGLNPYHSICHSPNVVCVNVREFVPQTFSIGWLKDTQTPAVSLFSSWYGRNHESSE